MMKRAISPIVAVLVVISFACSNTPPEPTPATDSATVAEPTTRRELPRTMSPDPREVHFSDLTMLTDGGENAEAYFSYSGDRLVFQSTRSPWKCDQILTMALDGSDVAVVSTGTGRTTCAYYYPQDDWIIYSSTHLGGDDCPPTPDHSRGYVWPLYESYDLFRVRPDGSDLEQLTTAAGYDAEATISPTGDRIIFTSVRNGDLDLYSMNIDGSDVVQLTDKPGYDGGAFYSPDGSKIVYRAHHPTTDEDMAEYSSLLNDGLIRPSELEVYVMNADGSEKRQVTSLGAASFGPFFHPSGEKIIFSSNHGNPSGREFELFLVDLDGSNLEQVTHSDGFDGFPMWAPDGETFVFCSNRDNSKKGETNIFVTRWIE